MNVAIGFSNGAQFGGDEVSDVVWPHLALQKRIFAESAQPFGDDLVEIAFLIRGDGDVQQFNFEGHENLKVSRKDKACSVDIGVPASRWHGRMPAEIAEYLAACYINAMPDVVAACRKRKMNADLDEVRRRLAAAMDEYKLRAPLEARRMDPDPEELARRKFVEELKKR